MMTRRKALKTTALAAAGAAILPAATAQQTAPAMAAAAPAGPFSLPALPYAFDALEPHIDAQTMQIHHDKHHAAYVANLNKAVAKYPDLQQSPVEYLLTHLNDMPADARTAIQNNGGGHYNHSVFWQMMKKGGGGEPTGEIAGAINKNFKNFANFRAAFADAATTRFGSGWAWLVLDRTKSLSILSTGNQDSPIAAGNDVLLGIDVWEHAYYLQYKNRRADYITAWFNVINWDNVADRYHKFMA